MKREKLTLVPVGGLANRMRAIVAAYNMCTLSRTAQIYGSANSTFSVMASKLEGKRLTVLRL